MGFWNWITGAVRSIGGFIHNVATSVWNGVKAVSRGIGRVEEWFDKALNWAHDVPVLRDIAHAIEGNDLYKSVRGVVDDVRGVVESDTADRVASGLAELTRPAVEDDPAHRLAEAEYHPIATGKITPRPIIVSPVSGGARPPPVTIQPIQPIAPPSQAIGGGSVA